eukprot:scaffold19479_cov111-Isochrysis_galbana.AAC.2
MAHAAVLLLTVRAPAHLLCYITITPRASAPALCARLTALCCGSLWSSTRRRRSRSRCGVFYLIFAPVVCCASCVRGVGARLVDVRDIPLKLRS